MSVVYASNGEVILTHRGLQACQQLEFSAILVSQYCKETKNRNDRLYDLRGVVISAMANDLKEFVKGIQDNKSKLLKHGITISASMVENIHEALILFGDLYDSGSCKKYALKLKELFPEVFKYKFVVDSLISAINQNGFKISRSDSASSSSIYLDIDYKSISSIRISDHYNEFEGMQLLLCKSKPEQAGGNGVFYVLEDNIENSLKSAVSYIMNSLIWQRDNIAKAFYMEQVNKKKSKYKEENNKFKEVR